MTNTVFGPYAKTVWTNGATPANATNMNHLETQASAALNGVNPDLLSAFILSGVTCAKDGVIANQLDIAAGRAYITLSDGTRGLIIVGADNTHTTSAISSTYHLYLQPDGTWYWSTSNSPATNSLAICTVTTDTSGNIATVTDNRVLATSLLGGFAGTLFLGSSGKIYGDASGNLTGASLIPGSGVIGYASPQIAYNTPFSGGVALGHAFGTWTGSAAVVPFSVGGQFNAAKAYVDNSGNIYGNIGGGPVQAVATGPSVTLSGTYQDVPGCTLTLATAGKYLVIGTVSSFNNGSGSCSLALNVNGARQSLTGYAGPTYIGTTGTFQGVFQVTQTWVVTVGAGQVVKLQVAGGGTCPSFDSTSGSTSDSAITAQYLHA